MTKNDTAFFFQLPKSLLEDIRATADENAISTSAFIRQSIAKNIRAYRAAENADHAAKAQSAFMRSV